MATTIKTLIPRKYAEAVQVGQYTASSTIRTVIDKFTVTNVTSSNVVFQVNLVALGDVAGLDNQVLSRTIPAGDTYLCPEISGQSLEPGGFLSTLAGAGSSLVISATGREIDIA